MELKEIAKAVMFVMICLIAGGIGSVFTIQSIPTWYATLIKPAFNPPNWLFGPVWTILYILMGIAAYLVYKEGAGKKEVKEAITVFGIQLALNVLWSLLFFGLHSPLYGFVCIIALWLSIALTMKKFHKISKTAGLLLVPYILWVSFATVLNFSIWMLN